MMMVALLVMGAFSLQRLGLDQYPNVDVPVVVVVTSYPGATPETVETEVTRPVEDALNAIGGLDEVTSTSYEGRSVVVAKFKRGAQFGRRAGGARQDRCHRGEFSGRRQKPVISRFDPPPSRFYRLRSVRHRSVCPLSPALPTRRWCGS